MKIRRARHFAFSVAIAWCLASAVWSQDIWPGITTEYGTTGAGVTRITYGNGGFLVTTFYLFAPPGGTTATSPDGFHWTVHKVTNSVIVGIVRGLSAGNSNFVAFGYDFAVTNGLIQFSDDGVVWGQPLVIPSVPLWDGVYANGTYVAVGQSAGNAAIVTSPDGVNWDTRTFPGYGPLYSITTGGGTFVAVGDSGAILTSADGSNWLTQVMLPGGDIYSVAYGNGMFVAVAPNFPTSVLTSTNGTNWVATPSPPLFEIGYGNGLFVGTRVKDIWASTNGVDWTEIWQGRDATELQGIAYGAGRFSVLRDFGFLVNVSPRAFLGWTAQTNGVVDLTLTGGWLGQSCRLQATTNLSATNWVDLLTFTNQGSVTHVQDIGATNYSQRFYRVAMP